MVDMKEKESWKLWVLGKLRLAEMLLWEPATVETAGT